LQQKRVGRTKLLPSLELIRELCEELAAVGVPYCHWKSNAALARSMSGDGDLDLLVSRAHAQAFSETLLRLGFRQVQDVSDPEMPGILHYYGYDRESGKLVHVHAHYGLIVGHEATKNCHLPVERAYLESAQEGNLIPIAAPEFELVVFVIRMVLKHSTGDAILGGQGRLSRAERRELEYLRARVSQTQMHSIVGQHLPWVSFRSITRGGGILRPSGESGWRGRSPVSRKRGSMPSSSGRMKT